MFGAGSMASVVVPRRSSSSNAGNVLPRDEHLGPSEGLVGVLCTVADEGGRDVIAYRSTL